MFADDALQGRHVEVVLCIALEVQHHARANFGTILGRLDRIGALAVRRPFPAFRLSGAARIDVDMVGDDEGRIETDAESADQRFRRPLVACPLELFHEGARAGIGDDAERLLEVFTAHADAIVDDRKSLRLLVGFDGDAERRVRAGNLPGRRLESQLFAGIRRVGNQLAQENVAVGIDGMDDEIEKSGDVGLERSLDSAARRAGRAIVHGVGHRLKAPVGMERPLISKCGLKIQRQEKGKRKGRPWGNTVGLGKGRNYSTQRLEKTARPAIAPPGGWGADEIRRHGEPGHRGNGNKLDPLLGRSRARLGQNHEISSFLAALAVLSHS